MPPRMPETRKLMDDADAIVSLWQVRTKIVLETTDREHLVVAIAASLQNQAFESIKVGLEAMSV